MRKKLLLFSTLFMILSLPVRALSQGDEKVDALIRKGWVVGRGDEDYALNETITRAEFTRMVVLLEEKNFESRPTEQPFLDVKKDAWFAPYIKEAARKQWIVGDGDGRFRPNDDITYAEVFAILTRLQNPEIAKGKPWYANYVANAEKWGYTRGIDIKDYRHKALRRHVFDGIYNLLEAREKAEKNQENKTYPTLTFEFEKSEKMPEKREIPKVKVEKIHKIKLIDGDKIREINAPHGKTIDKPNVENREGYNFVGWFDGEESFDFKTPITSNLSLTAKFEPKTYLVKFTNGDEVVESRVEHAKIVEEPSDPVKEGYNFVGWFNGKESFDFKTPITSDLSLTAKFEPKTYLVKFTSGDEVVESRVEHGKTVEKPDAPVKDGFNFIGWFDGEEAFDFKTPITSALSLTAKFEPKTYTVKFTNGDEVVESRVEHGKIAEKPSDPIKEGYNFVGWFNGEEAFDFDKPITSDINLTAKFEAKIYTVKFTDGDEVIESRVEHGKTVGKPDIPIKEGFEFVGWFDGEGIFDFETPITSDINLTAKFEPKTYTVKFTDGDQVVESQVEHGKIVEKPSDPVKEGYNFVGWFNGEESFDFKTPITSDLSFTAKFEPKTYTVTFVNGDEEISQTVKHGECATEPTKPTKVDFIFLGWFDGEVKFGFKNPITSDTFLNAKFAPAKVTIQIWDEEGKNLISSETIPYGSSYSFPKSPKQGYRAEYISGDASYETGSSIYPKKDISFKMRLIKRIKIRFYVDDTGPTDPGKRPNSFGGHQVFVDKGSLITPVPKFAYFSTRYPLMRYDRENGRFDPEPFDLSTPITEPIYLVSIQKGTAYRYPIFIYVEPGGNPNGHYKKVWVDKIEDIPKVDFKSGGYHTDGWREVDKAERYEFVNNFGAARGKVFVPYWVKDE